MSHTLRSILLLLLISHGASSLSRAADNVCSAGYITDEVRGEETIDQFGSKYQAVNVFSYQFNGECRVVAKSPWVEDMGNRLRNDPNRLILINIVNEIELTPGPCRNLSTGQLLHNILSDPAKRADHIREIKAISAIAQGIEIDYEHVLAQTTPFLTQFMQELRAALPSDKRLGQVVQAKTQGGGEQGQTVDWRGIEPYVDYIRVMAYYYSWSTSVPGTVITYAKLNQLADYILTSPTQSIPAAKARIMISLYGWDWPISPKSPGRLVRFEEAMELATTHNATMTRDPVQDTLHFQYTDSSGTLHEVWFDDVVGHQKRVQLLLDKNFPAIDVWHLSTGDPAFWQWYVTKMRSDCPSYGGIPPTPSSTQISQSGPATVKVGAPATTVKLAGTSFNTDATVLMNGNPVFPTSITPNEIQINIPSDLLQKASVQKLSVSQNAQLTNSVNFYVVGNPVVDTVDPAIATAKSPPFILKIKGQGYEPNTVVEWNNIVVPKQFVSGNELHATISPDINNKEGPIRVRVTNPTSGALIGKFVTVLPVGQVPPGGPSPNLLISGFSVGPNPWKADKNMGGIRFFGTAQGDELKIFSVAGRFVRNLTGVTPITEWDLKNEDGENVASGMYLFLLKKNGSVDQKGTLVVVR